jgi:HEAT repeat protein
MRRLFQSRLFLFAVLIWAFGCGAGWCGERPSRADLDKTVVAASVYEPGQSLESFRLIEQWVSESLNQPELRKQVEASLITMLAPSSTFEAKRFACKQLGAIGSEEALPELAKLLRDEKTAAIACLALTTYPTGKADEVLRSALESAPGSARIQVINLLGDRRDAKAVRALLRLLRDRDPSTSEAALAALGKIGNMAAWKAVNSLQIEGALAPGWAEAMFRCAENLAKSGDEKVARNIYEKLMESSRPAYVRRAALQGLLTTDKDLGEARMLEIIHGPDEVLRPVAIAAVRTLRSENASAKFAAEMPQLAPEEQIWMIDSLAARGDDGARIGIEKGLGFPELTVREASASALGKIGDASTVGALAAALASSPESESSKTIEAALVGLSGGRVTDEAITAELKKSAGASRAHLLTALALRQGAAANEVLLRETESANPAVARAAFMNLGRSAQAGDLPVLLSRMCLLTEPNVRAEAEGAARLALGKVEDTARRSAIVRDELQRAKTPQCRMALLGLLPLCADSLALEALKSAAASPEAEVKEVAVRAFADWPDLSGWDTLFGFYQNPENEKIRGIALSGLVRLAGEENPHADQRLLERYQQLLSNAHGEAETKLILGALGGAASPGALPLVIPFLSDSNVRAEAQAAIKRIAEAIKGQHPQAAAEALQRLEAKQ